ncbi:adenylate cyclase [Bacillus inaquosorum]|uniref:adenylate cyclase n=1 Tax=Bacillus inaquosorum TaxID=483913 RepID=UPI00227FC686|nr:adenylate cyclase [Bacillus inaquosorum]MCY7911118.1 adenylate cyclase [Bacillus inaquosorum]
MKFKEYDFRKRKIKVEEILDNTDAVNEVNKFPKNDEEFTYTNGYKAWASAIFVDLRDSTSLFSDKNDVDVAKIIRGFTSEVIEILIKDTDDDMMEVGIRGDCVYAIYSTSTKADLYDVSYRASYINTYIKMLNKLLQDRHLPIITVGIGLAAEETLAVKAGRKSSGINNLVWIGESVAKASKLSDLGNKNGIGPIVMSKIFYNNYIDIAMEKNEESKSWWYKKTDTSYGEFYHGDVIIVDFNKWVSDGMNS